MGSFQRLSNALPLLLLALALVSLLSLSGCLGPVADQDKFNSNLTYNLSQYLVPGSCSPLNTPTPCTCMVCSSEKSFWSKIPLIGSLFSKGTLESSLAGSNCQFVNCNSSIYLNYVALDSGGKPQTCLLNGKTQQCVPRFFMLGQGPSGAEFSMAQRYCAGRLTMPVIWATPKATADGRLPAPSAPPAQPAPAQMMCYLSRDQMPVVVPYARGQNIPVSYYETLASSYNQPDATPPVSGPVVITTQALADAYLPPADPAKPDARLLDKGVLDSMVAQVKAVNDKCPSCLTALALKPRFDAGGRPDLCALDYLLNSTPTDPPGTPSTPERPAQLSNGCAAEFGMSDAAYDAMRIRPDGYARLSDRTDSTGQYVARPLTVLGVGFIANDDPDIPSCSAQGEIGRYLLYSRMALNAYYKPSVWYAAGFAAGNTSTPGCTFSDADVSGAYNSMLSGISGFSASGVIGLAPYRFLDAPAGLPVACTQSGDKLFSVGGGQTLTDVQPGVSLASADGSQVLKVARLQSATPALVSFLGDDNAGYVARVDSGTLSVYRSACNYGFRDSSGQLREPSSFAWFSNCKFYFTNNGAFDPSASNPPSLTDKSTQQPAMFSTNGRGAVCSVFSANKMYNHIGATPQPVVPSADPAEQQRIASLQCGACLSDAPMPKAFCPFSSKFRARDLAFGPTDSSGNHPSCTQYAQMDDVFLLKGADPVLMRSFAITETSLGYTADTGSTASACLIGSVTTSSCGGESVNDLTASPSAYCSAADIQSVLSRKSISDSGPNYACGLGVMQCIKAPNTPGTSSYDPAQPAYNPFNPYDSASCGSDEFLYRFKDRQKLLTALRANNPAFASEVSPAEVDWYAAWLAADGYYGMWLAPGSSNFKPGDVGTADYINTYPAGYAGGFVQYMYDYYTNEQANHPNWQPGYGLKIMLRYNAGVQACGSGCAYQTCP